MLILKISFVADNKTYFALIIILILCLFISASQNGDIFKRILVQLWNAIRDTEMVIHVNLFIIF